MVKKGLINVPQGFGNIFWEKIWMEIFNNFSFYIQNPTIYTIQHYTVILRPSLFQRIPDDLSLLLLCRSPDQENKGGDINKNKNQKKKLGDSLNAI